MEAIENKGETAFQASEGNLLARTDGGVKGHFGKIIDPPLRPLAADPAAFPLTPAFALA
jgi:hypothetical protein